MDAMIFAQASYAVVVILLTVISAVLLLNSPLSRTSDNKNTILYFTGFFIATGLGFLSFLFKPLFNEYLSVAITNFMFLVNVYCIRFGLMWRQGQKLHLHKVLNVWIHMAIFVSSQVWSLHYLADSMWFRVANVSANAILVLIGCLLLIRNKETTNGQGEQIATAAHVFVITCYVLMPILYIAVNNDFYFKTLVLVIQVISVVSFMGGLLCLLMSDVIEQHYQHSIKDPLTNIFNRRYFFQTIREMSDNSLELSTNSVVLCDIDKFKRINDKYGHDIGDVVLTQFANLLNDKIGGQGIVARYGGEEFTILMFHRSLPQAITLADELRKDCQDMKVNTSAGEINLTASFGVSEVWDLADIDLALKLADDALLRAKASGRNQVLAN